MELARVFPAYQPMPRASSGNSSGFEIDWLTIRYSIIGASKTSRVRTKWSVS